MATPSATIVGAKPVTGDGDYAIATWVLTTADHTGVAISYHDYADRTVQVFGTFGGATITWEGSLNNTNFEALTDPQGNAIAKSTAALEAVSEAVPYIRPRLSTVGVGADITAILYAKKAK